MICPVEIASEMSALQTARDESSGSDFAGSGEEDHWSQAAEIISISDRGVSAMRSLGFAGYSTGGGASLDP
jgi:hypothetical protein